MERVKRSVVARGLRKEEDEEVECTGVLRQ